MPLSDTDPPAAITELVRAVLALIGTARDDPSYQEKSKAVLKLCNVALEAVQAALDEVREAAAKPVPTGPGNVALRIAELAAQGKGVREIARQVGVNPSTVSRRLRKARAEAVACNT